MHAVTRRSFARAMMVPLARPLAAAGPRPMRLGGPIFMKSDDPRELAREHRRLGYNAAYCPQAKVTETDRIRAILRFDELRFPFFLLIRPIGRDQPPFSLKSKMFLKLGVHLFNQQMSST